MSIASPAFPVRWFATFDSPQIESIDGASEGSWGLDAILSYYDRLPGAALVALGEDDLAVGFCCFKMLRRRYRIDRIAIDPAQRRRGVARTLVEHLATMAVRTSRSELSAVVGDDRLDCHLFLRTVGFRAVAIKDGDGRAWYRFTRLVGDSPQ